MKQGGTAMNKMLKIGVLCIVFLLCDCQVQAQKIETTQNNAIQYELTKKLKYYPHFLFGSIKTVGYMAVLNTQIFKIK